MQILGGVFVPKVTVIHCDIKTPPQLTKMCVAAYCRVSADALEQSSSLEAQIDYYTKMIEENPLLFVVWR